MTVVLDICFKESLKRSQGWIDVHERDPKFLEKVRRNYLRLARRFGWVVLDGERSVEAVGEDVWRVVEDFLCRFS